MQFKPDPLITFLHSYVINEFEMFPDISSSYKYKIS